MGLILGASVSLLTGFSYVELSSMFPKEAAEYVYFKKATGRENIAFLIEWAEIFSEIVGAATVALGFAGYLRAFFNIPIPFITILLIMFLSVLNFSGIKESLTFNIILALVEVLGLILIIALGAFYGKNLSNKLL